LMGGESRIGGGSDSPLGKRNRLLSWLDLAAGRLQFALDVGEPVLAGETACSAGRRIRGNGKAVPAPQVAFARDEPLTRLEQPRKARGVFAGDNADLQQPALQRLRCPYILRERLRALRQGRIGRIEVR